MAALFLTQVSPSAVRASPKSIEYAPRKRSHQEWQREDEKRPKETKTHPLLLFRRRHEGDVGRKSGASPPAPNFSASALLSSSRSLRSHSDSSLPASRPAGASLSISVVGRKSSTAWLHLPSSRRYRSTPRRGDAGSASGIGTSSTGWGPILRPAQVLPGKAVTCLQLVEPRGEP